MKILIVMWGKDGGIPKLTYAISKALCELGHDVTAILSSKVYNKVEWDNSKKIKTCYIDTGDKANFFLTSLKMLTSLRTKILNLSGHYDLSITTDNCPWNLYISKLLSVKRKYIICHDPIPHSGTNLLMKFISYLSLVGYDDCIVMTKKFIPVIEKKYHYNYVNIHYMRHGRYDYSPKFKNKVQISKDSIINFLFFGRISSYKGIDILLEAYEQVRNNGLTQLTIAGSGNISEYQSKIKSLDVILINRFIEDEEICNLFSIPNTVVVLPYIDATQSGIIPIAIDYCCPIIASNTGGLKEQLFDGKIGSLFEAGNSTELAQVMESYISSPQKIIAESQKMIKYQSKLDWKNILVDLLRE